jgi:inhibitor of cysteine peptidase
MRRFVSIVLMLAALIGAALFSSTRATSHPLNDEPVREVRVGEADQGIMLTLDEDQPLVISLPGNPSTGYVWEVAEIDTGLLQQVGEVSYEPLLDISGTPEISGAPAMIGAPEKIGAPAMMTLRFVARGAGESTLRLEYRRPWETGQVERNYAVRVQTKAAFNRTGWLEQFQAEPIIEAQTLLADEKAVPEERYAVPDEYYAIPQGQLQASTLPSSFSWCDQGGCTPVRDQGNCGSCWAFATVGPLESLIKLSMGVNKNLSEQFLVSCNLDGDDCDGGWWAHDYHWNKLGFGQLAAGAVYEADYPYTATSSACSNYPHTHYEKIISWAYVNPLFPYSVPSVASIKQAIYEHGPVAVSLYTGSDFNKYPGGVFKTSQTGTVNHGVVLVGWDDSLGTAGAWRLRNSWGTGWGEGGYMWIEYGVSQVGYGASYVNYPMLPDVPSNLQTMALSMHEIELEWADNSFNETGFRIERSLDGVSGWAVVNSTAADVMSYSDSGLSSGTTYYYRVQAFNTAGGSAYTNIASAAPFASVVFIPGMLANYPPDSFGLPIGQSFENQPQQDLGNL